MVQKSISERMGKLEENLESGISEKVEPRQMNK